MTMASFTAVSIAAGGAETSSDTTIGRMATARSPARRAMALFTPDAAPRCSPSADAMIVAVSGATVHARPRPNTIAPGSTAST